MPRDSNQDHIRGESVARCSDEQATWHCLPQRLQRSNPCQAACTTARVSGGMTVLAADACQHHLLQVQTEPVLVATELHSLHDLRC